MSAADTCFLVAAPGLEGVLLEEAREVGLPDPRGVEGGVEVGGGLDAGMRACLWLRTATTVRLRLGAFPARTETELKRGLGRIDWPGHLPRRGACALHATSRGSRLKHTGMLFDRVAAAAPAASFVRGTAGVHLRLDRDRAEVSLDLAGDRLHQRGWRREGGAAPLRETLAAGLLRLCGFGEDEAFVDPMCGSGTLAIEAALVATRTASGLGRAFAFEAVPAFDPRLWTRLQEEARAARRAARAPILATDLHPGAVGSTRRNAARAGVEDALRCERRDVKDAAPPEGAPPGLLLTNPPYGARIGPRGGGDLAGLHAAFGAAVSARFPGWRVAFVTSEPRLARATGLPLERRGALRNGGLPVGLFVRAG